MEKEDVHSAWLARPVATHRSVAMPDEAQPGPTFLPGDLAAALPDAAHLRCGEISGIHPLHRKVVILFRLVHIKNHDFRNDFSGFQSIAVVDFDTGARIRHLGRQHQRQREAPHSTACMSTRFGVFSGGGSTGSPSVSFCRLLRVASRVCRRSSASNRYSSLKSAGAV
jgi:hypothetical protein